LISPVPPKLPGPTPQENLRKKMGREGMEGCRETFIQERGGNCEWCGSIERLTVHHRSATDTGTVLPELLSLWLCSAMLEVPCSTSRRKDPCEREHADGENHYRWHDAEMCSYCFLQEHRK
jgi:hypothetical protein